MEKHHLVANVHFEGDELVLSIDGALMRYSIAQVSRVLLNASETDRNKFEISPSGYGIHWPNLDEDISIDGLLGIVHVRECKKQAA
jgi:hypothetical protein